MVKCTRCDNDLIADVGWHRDNELLCDNCYMQALALEEHLKEKGVKK